MLCVFCVVIHRRVSAGAARPRRPPLREVVFFLQKMASSPSCFLPGRGSETQGKTLRGASRQPPQAAFTSRTRPSASPGVFLPRRGASRTRSRPAEGRAKMGRGSPVLCAKRFLWLRKKGGTAVRETRRGFIVFFAGCPGTVTAGGGDRRVRGDAALRLCVCFNSG